MLHLILIFFKAFVCTKMLCFMIICPYGKPGQCKMHAFLNHLLSVKAKTMKLTWCNLIAVSNGKALNVILGNA